MMHTCLSIFCLIVAGVADRVIEGIDVVLPVGASADDWDDEFT